MNQFSTPLQIRKATKSKSRLRIGVSGPSGSGKTFSALLLASGLTSWEKICIIDTENGSADLYDHLGEFNVIPLQAPYSPERYIEAIRAAEAAGMEVIIVDSATHEWDGKGGCLENNEKLAQAKFRGNTWAAWSVTTPRHQAFIEAIVSSKCHIITTARSKVETIQIDNKIKKVGTKEIQRDGFEYELTANFNIDRDGHLAIASKDRTGIFIDLDPFVISMETGQTLKKWADSGIEPVTPVTAPAPKQAPTTKKTAKTKAVAMASQKQVDEIKVLLEKKGYTMDRLKEYVHKRFNKTTLDDVTFQEAEKVIKKLQSFPDVPSLDADPIMDATTPTVSTDDVTVEDVEGVAEQSNSADDFEAFADGEMKRIREESIGPH